MSIDRKVAKKPIQQNRIKGRFRKKEKRHRAKFLSKIVTGNWHEAV